MNKDRHTFLTGLVLLLLAVLLSVLAPSRASADWWEEITPDEVSIAVLVDLDGADSVAPVYSWPLLPPEVAPVWFDTWDPLDPLDHCGLSYALPWLPEPDKQRVGVGYDSPSWQVYLRQVLTEW